MRSAANVKLLGALVVFALIALPAVPAEAKAPGSSFRKCGKLVNKIKRDKEGVLTYALQKVVFASKSPAVACGVAMRVARSGINYNKPIYKGRPPRSHPTGWYLTKTKPWRGWFPTTFTTEFSGRSLLERYRHPKTKAKVELWKNNCRRESSVAVPWVCEDFPLE